MRALLLSAICAVLLSACGTLDRCDSGLGDPPGGTAIPH